MCFSAEASFIAGISLTAAGIVTVRTVKHKNELPFALIPLFFGLQQIAEGFVWLSFSLDSQMLNQIMTTIYSFFYRIFWPVYTPFAIWMLEPNPKYKKILIWFIPVGLIAGIHYLYTMLQTPVISHITNHSLVYGTPYFSVPFWPIFFLAYFIATTVSCFFSTQRAVNMLGILLFFFAMITYTFYALSFVSVWCFFAAVISLVVYLHFRHPHIIPEFHGIIHR